MGTLIRSCRSCGTISVSWLEWFLISGIRGRAMQKDWGWKKRPCRICGRWFVPHPRLKGRQKTCADAQCKREWHRRKCAQWNKDNADYFKSNYLQKKLEATLVCKSRFRSGLPLVFAQEVIGSAPSPRPLPQLGGERRRVKRCCSTQTNLLRLLLVVWRLLW